MKLVLDEWIRSGQSGYSLTENGSWACSTTESKVLDFFFDILQGSKKDDVYEKLSESWKEDPLLTLKVVFQLRDIRKGKGAIKEFHYCLAWLYENHPKTFFHNLEHVVKHGYWKDLSWFVKFILTGEFTMVTPDNRKYKKGDDLKKRTQLKHKQMRAARRPVDHGQQTPKNPSKKDILAATSLRVSQRLEQDLSFATLYDKVVTLFASALQQDVQHLASGKNLDITRLAGKWAPTIDCSIDSNTLLGRNIAFRLFPRLPDEEQSRYELRAFMGYRKQYLTPLRQHISVVESFMSRSKWSVIPYERVPSVSMKRNKESFLEKDKERFTEFLQQVKEGTKKMASGALLPHEIVRDVQKNKKSKDLLNVCQLQWESYVAKLKESGLFESALSVCDVSGSMSGEPMEVAIALSLLTAQLSKPPFNDVVCTFSSRPELHKIPNGTLLKQVNSLSNANWEMNTDLQAVFDLILKLAEETKLPACDMVKTLFIFSDMQFDYCGGAKFETDYKVIQRKFQEANYPMPTIVFWNLRAIVGCKTKPVTKNEQNVALVSGFSANFLKYFLETGSFTTPYAVMLATLGNHYDHLQVVDWYGDLVEMTG